MFDRMARGWELAKESWRVLKLDKELLVFPLVSGLACLVVLLSFAVAAFFSDFPRLYIYGLMLALAPFVGEWLYQRLGAAHHGFPIVFGTATGIILLNGAVQFVRLLRNNPLPPEEPLLEEG